jgi:hypothetical protein
MSRTGDLYLQAILDSEDSAELARKQRDKIEGPEEDLEAYLLTDLRDIVEIEWWND